MLGDLITKSLVLILGYAYPALECLKAIEKHGAGNAELRFWCQYWVIIAALTVFERIGDVFISWVPMYGEMKLALIIYLWYSKTKGTEYVYNAMSRPFVARHETGIERSLNEMRAKAWDVAIYYWHNSFELGQSIFFEILHYLVSKPSWPRSEAPANIPTNYEDIGFQTQALQLSKIDLTWNENEAQRLKKLKKKVHFDQTIEPRQRMEAETNAYPGSILGQSIKGRYAMRRIVKSPNINDIDPRIGSSSSSSTYDHTYIYDVYLSFRGADTRNGFTDHLYNALLDAGINKTFLDDEEIETGEPLKHELESAIKSSRASIIVLSKNYAFSTRCLDELVLILEQQQKFNQIVIPILYHVEPTNVTKQQSSLGEAMKKHKQRMEEETNTEKRSQLRLKMGLWKEALTQVVDLSAKNAKGRIETELIDEVITYIHSRLDVRISNTLSHLIGMDHHIKSISSWVTDGSRHTADIFTIVGMDGIGKTSLARYVFGLHSGKFQKVSFIEDINTRCKEKFTGLLDLQKQLYGDISENIPLQVNDVSVYTSKIENALAHKRVFIVLDDIGSCGQLDELLGNKGLHPGSKVIVTTKDVSLIERCALFKRQVPARHYIVYLLNILRKSESLELLCIHAFKSRKPKQGYKEILEKLLNGCDGQPFVLQVLGSSLYMQDVAYWEDYIDVLQKEPHFHINQALKMSFNSLPFENDKDLFMHIACFFVGTDRDVTEIILNACDIYTRSGITNLIDRCLLSIGRNNELIMHQLVQEMGRDLVRQESPDKPWKRSRLWCHEESLEVLTQKNGKGNLLGLVLDMRMLDKKKLHELETESLSKMDNLMLLQLNYVRLNGRFENFPKELRWLCMHGSPLKSIPLDLPMENLVVLDMSYSNIESFDMSYTNPLPSDKRQKVTGSCSKDKRLLGSLKILDLSFCEQLLNVGGFLELPTLERLIVRNCISLVTMCESVEQCVELVHIDLSYCDKLKTLPMSIGKLKKIKTLFLYGCNFQ